MPTLRAALAIACAAAIAATACGGASASSSTTTTSPTPVAADATTSETFATTLSAGDGIFYSFSIAVYGNVAVTLTGVSGADLPEDLTLGVGIGRPSGTSCTTSTAISTGPGTVAQLTGTYGPGVFCVRIYDNGTLTGPVRVSATVAHP